MTRKLLGGALAALLVLAGCGTRPSLGDDLAVGASADPESVLVAELYAAALRYYGTPAHVAVVGDPVAALDSGDVSVAPGFTGRLLQRFAPGAGPVQEQNVYRAMMAALPEGVAAGDYTTAAQDKPTVALTDAVAREWNAKDVAALVARCAQLTPGVTAGTAPPTEFGGCTPRLARVFPDDAALFAALRAGAINAAWTTTASPGVPADVVILVDRRPAVLAADNVVPLYRRNALSERQMLALNEIAGELDTAELTEMRRQVATGADPRQVAQEWLSAHPLGR